MKKMIFLWAMLGLIVVAVPIFNWHKSNEYQNHLIDTFEKQLENAKVSTQKNTKFLKEDIQNKTTNLENSNKTKRCNIAQNSKQVLGMIEIPKLEIKYAIVEDTKPQNIRYTIGHMVDTVALGDIGNCILAGHRGGKYGQFFKHLDKLVKGDEVNITDTKGEIHVYVVVRAYTVNPKDYSVKKTSREKILNLITCENKGKKRFIIECIGKTNKEKHKL